MKTYLAGALSLFLLIFVSCGGGPTSNSDGAEANAVGGNPVNSSGYSGVLMWKGDTSGRGLYASESQLNLQNVNARQFGKLAQRPVDGMIMAQPLYVAAVPIGGANHNIVIVATEHDSVYAFDADDPNAAPLWERHYAIDGATPAPDNFGGRTTIGGEIGITGTPVIDPATGALYFVTTIQRNGAVEQWLRSIDIKTGNDFGSGSAIIQASVIGDGKGSDGGTIHFDSRNHNQRAGLMINNGAVIIAWGSFSDWGVYHGWMMAYGLADLQQKAVLNLSPQHQDQDSAYGPADFGGGASVWQAGAPPTADDSGNIYIAAADGSFNAHTGGLNFGDTVLKIRFTGNSFQVLDWFTPSNQACVNAADMEIGSGGVVQLPGGLGLTVNKEGRVYLLNLANMGKYVAGDTQIPQQFLAGQNECYEGLGPDHAEGLDWQRLYGNPSFWNGNVYLAPSNGPLRQYVLQGSNINPSPIAQSPTVTGPRGGSTVVSPTGAGAIVWMYQKSANGNAILHAYDATNIGHELWNSTMNPNDEMGNGNSFGTPVVANGKVFVTFDKALVAYGLR